MSSAIRKSTFGRGLAESAADTGRATVSEAAVAPATVPRKSRRVQRLGSGWLICWEYINRLVAVKKSGIANSEDGKVFITLFAPYDWLAYSAGQ